MGRGAFIAAQAPALSQIDQEIALRRSAKQLAVEATQLQVPSPKVITVVREELGALSGEREADTPVKFSVLGGEKSS